MDQESLIAHVVADLRFASDEVGHDVIVVLWAGDFNLSNLQTGAIQEKGLVCLRHLTDGKTKNNKMSGGIV